MHACIHHHPPSESSRSSIGHEKRNRRAFTLRYKRRALPQGTCVPISESSSLSPGYGPVAYREGPVHMLKKTTVSTNPATSQWRCEIPSIVSRPCQGTHFQIPEVNQLTISTDFTICQYVNKFSINRRGPGKLYLSVNIPAFKDIGL